MNMEKLKTTLSNMLNDEILSFIDDARYNPDNAIRECDDLEMLDLMYFVCEKFEDEYANNIKELEDEMSNLHNECSNIEALLEDQEESYWEGYKDAKNEYEHE